MKTVSRFRRLPDPEVQLQPTVAIFWNEQVIEARAGDNLAAVLLAGGVTSFRNAAVSGESRAPFCMMGSCFECLVTIDKVPNKQACMTVVTDGMKVETGRPYAALSASAGGDSGDDI